MSIEKILVVDDDPENLPAAEEFFESKGIAYAVARDYQEARRALDSEAFTGVLTDLFFPEETGSGRRALGQKTIDKIIEGAYGQEGIAAIRGEVTAPIDKRAAIEDAFLQHVDLSGKDLERLRNYAAMCASPFYRDTSGNLIRAVAARSSRGSRTEATNTLREFLERSECDSLPMDLRSLNPTRGPVYAREMYVSMKRYLEEDERNQPLGVLVAEEAVAKGVPAMVISSMYHHSYNVQPIGDYYGSLWKKALAKGEQVSSVGWGMICNFDGSSHPLKSQPEAWQIAYEKLSELRNRMKE